MASETGAPRRGFARRSRTGTLTGTALLLAMGVVLPVALHGIPLGGRIFLPMHIPALIAGLLLGPAAGLVVGAGSPIVGVLVTGRPPVLYLVPMIFELATYGVAAGLLRPAIERALGVRAGAPRRAAALFVSLLLAMLAGRLVWMAVAVWLAPAIGLNARPVAAALAAIGAGWPGMAIQLGLIPAIVRAIERPSSS